MWENTISNHDDVPPEGHQGAQSKDKSKYEQQWGSHSLAEIQIVSAVVESVRNHC